MTSLDRLVSRMRVWIEDSLPWYDRAEEAKAEARTEELRAKAVAARIDWEARIDKIYRERLVGTRR